MIGAGYPIALGQSWWVHPSQSCWPTPGPGGLLHVATSAAGTGASAFGMGSGSTNGLRISGLVGNVSIYRLSPNARVGRRAREPIRVAPPAMSPSLSISRLVHLTYSRAFIARFLLHRD